MSEIVNLRRARKAKGRSEKASEAHANRAKHGVAKKTKALAKARADLDAHRLGAHHLKDKE